LKKQKKNEQKSKKSVKIDPNSTVVSATSPDQDPKKMVNKLGPPLKKKIVVAKQ
jgi:hypothetical protein